MSASVTIYLDSDEFWDCCIEYMRRHLKASSTNNPTVGERWHCPGCRAVAEYRSTPEGNQWVCLNAAQYKHEVMD